MKIEQARVSISMSVFKHNFLKKYKLLKYHDVTKPCVFFGCYKHYQRDCAPIMKHKGFAVVIWGGTDVQKLRYKLDMYKAFKHRPDIWHIAISDYTERDLKALGFNYKKLPICPTRIEYFKPVPLGPHIYAYSSHTRQYDYGDDILVKVKRKMPDMKFITGHCHYPDHFEYEMMPKIYAKCFIGLRFTRHDGLSNTVVELGLMGRKCFWNGGSANQIPWGEDNICRIVRKIRAEQINVGKINMDIANATRKWLNIGDSWLDTDFYK